MNRRIYDAIVKSYEKKQKAALDRVNQRKDQIYQEIPRIKEIDTEIRLSGIKHNKMILMDDTAASQVVNHLSYVLQSLRDEKSSLLRNAGYPEDYLEMTYECPVCKDTGYIGSGVSIEKCSCFRQQVINHLFKSSNLKLAQYENFSNFNESLYPDAVDEAKYGISISPRNNIMAVRQKCMQFIDGFASPEIKNLFFSGPTGVGKTFMSSCIAVDLLNKGRTVLYQTAPRLFEMVNEYKARAGKEESLEESGYKDILDVELLIIDDLGTEPTSSARYAEFLTIINTRQMNNLTKPCKTIISTNIGPRDLYEYYTERVASRIIGCFDMFRFAGEDIRTIKKSSAAKTVNL